MFSPVITWAKEMTGSFHLILTNQNLPRFEASTLSTHHLAGSLEKSAGRWESLAQPCESNSLLKLDLGQNL